MKVISIVGARPQFIKLAPMSRSLAQFGIEHKVIHSGQHFDKNMSNVFFTDLEIEEPDYQLNVGGESTAAQISEVIRGCEPIIEVEKPSIVLVYGDTNTTLGGAIATKSLGVSLGHIEAGLRSHNRVMQEELNRIAVDHLSDIRFCPTEESLNNLALENLWNKSFLTGDIMKDSFQFAKDKNVGISYERDFSNAIFCTIHRAENTDVPERVISIMESLSRLDGRVVLAVHPRLKKRLDQLPNYMNWPNIEFIEPLSYLETIHALISCKSVITDSGGLQKDAWFADKTCTTLRTETEWPETLKESWNLVCPNLENLEEFVNRVKPDTKDSTLFGEGYTAEKITRRLMGLHNSGTLKGKQE